MSVSASTIIKASVCLSPVRHKEDNNNYIWNVVFPGVGHHGVVLQAVCHHGVGLPGGDTLAPALAALAVPVGRAPRLTHRPLHYHHQDHQDHHQDHHHYLRPEHRLGALALARPRIKITLNKNKICEYGVQSDKIQLCAKI